MITLEMKGLSCANCASKIEERVNNLSTVKEATMNLMSRTMKIEANATHDKDSIIEETKKIVSALEPDVVVLEKGKKQPQADGDSCGCDHCHTSFDDIQNAEEKTSFWDAVKDYAKNNKIMMVGFTLFIIGITLRMPNSIEIGVYLTSYLLVGSVVLVTAGKNILRGQVFDEHFLMAIATVGALALGEYPEAVAVMVFWQIGEAFQDFAVNNSRKNIKGLLDLKAEYANLQTADGLKQVDPETVQVNDLIVIKPGEKVPLDGVVISGKAMMDTAALTGESVPRSVSEGDDVLSGFINKNSVITVKVTKLLSESTASKILDLVENASAKKSKTEQFITKFARYYTPVVVIAAALLAVVPPLVVPGATFPDWIERALIFLVVSCPCGLVVSIPLGFFGGIGSASKHGILVKGGNYLEALNSVTTIVFDKTGTLTKGVFKVADIKQANDFTPDEIIEMAAMVEGYSNHPIAKSIREAYGQEFDENRVKDFEEISGHGIKALVDDRAVAAGNYKLMEQLGLNYNEPHEVGTIVHVAIDRKYAGYIVIADELKEDVMSLTDQLHKAGIKKAIMLTGDHKSIASKIASQLKLDDFRAELLPGDKVDEFERIKDSVSNKERVAFVGDGINDAPVLARADIGISMGGVGSDAAIEASDIVLMTDEPKKIVEAKLIALMTRKIVWQNIIFALGIKVGVLLMATVGMATMWAAIFADVGVALLAILNASRILKAEIKVD
ncbi:heavy metal translocating P-type ATPase [Vallitalea okinawensis]|uniref:heavy metal translocating P-type ATPase n=1 Tax=Vallitalea okinawensis TaxID=2078660 RepID=UPI001FA8F043|nr:heavy metal translocating P-type ATPase [Vallitalea okinawensis]